MCGASELRTKQVGAVHQVSDFLFADVDDDALADLSLLPLLSLDFDSVARASDFPSLDFLSLDFDSTGFDSADFPSLDLSPPFDSPPDESPSLRAPAGSGAVPRCAFL